MANGLFDGIRATAYTIGAGVLNTDFEILSAGDVTSTGVIDRVIAVVIQPGGKVVERLRSLVYADLKSQGVAK